MPKDNEIEQDLKNALKEWMDEKFALFGKWSLSTLAVLTLTGLIYFILTMTGWKFSGP